MSKFFLDYILAYLRNKCFLLIIVFYGTLFPVVYEQAPHFLYNVNDILIFPEEPESFSVKGNFSLSHQSATNSFDVNGETVPLFGKFGKIDFSKLASTQIGLSKDLDSNVMITKTKTSTFINQLRESYKSYNQRVYLDGKWEMSELNIALSAVVPVYSIFAELHFPFRSISIKDLLFVENNSTATPLLSYLNQEFDNVLIENNYVPLKEGFLLKGIGDLTILVGWQGKEVFNTTKIYDSWGKVALGFILPFSNVTDDFKNLRFVHSPLYYGGSFGTTLRYNGGINFKKGFELCMYGEHNTFFKKEEKIQYALSSKMKMFNFYDALEIDVRRGSFWKIGGYINSSFILDELSVQIGYSYQSQEDSCISYSSKKVYEKPTFYDLELVQQVPVSGSPSLDEINRIDRAKYVLNESVLNSDPRLGSSTLHVFHVGISAQPKVLKKYCEVGAITLSFSLPFWGKSTFISKEFLVQAGLLFSLNNF